MLSRDAGRQLYGQDPAAYDAGRPAYPDRVFAVLRSRCGLRPGSRVIEIGPGTGLATRRLLSLGAAVTAAEPSASMARYLKDAAGDAALNVITASFEDAPLGTGTFDLAVAAYSWHWVDPLAGPAKLRRVLAPGGWVAFWWTLYGDSDESEEFNAAVTAILGETPGHSEPGRPARGGLEPSGTAPRLPMQIDETRHRASLTAAGFTEVSSELIAERVRLTAAEVRALFATMAIVLRRDAAQRPALLDAVEELVSDRFGGAVEREFVTGLYTARNR